MSQNIPAKGGPVTPEGKRISSLNAVKTGLTGRTVLLAADDADAYRALLVAYEAEYKPVGLRESELVQSMADTQWRLQRIPTLESAIYARGRHEFAESHSDKELSLRIALIDLDTHLKYERQLRNLQLQESRLTRRFDKESAELRQLQKNRTTPVKGPEFVFSNQRSDKDQSLDPPPITRSNIFNVATNTLNTPANSISAPGIGLSANGERSTLLVE